MNNRQRSRKAAATSSAGSRKSLSGGDCTRPPKRERREIFLFALLMKFLVAVKLIKRLGHVYEKVEEMQKISFSDKSPFCHFHFTTFAI